MTFPTNIKRVFLSGISGTGMTALANLLIEKGLEVYGSDNHFYPPTGDFLKNLPVRLYEGFSEKNIMDANPELIIIGNALSRNNPEVEYVLNEKRTFLSMAGAIKFLFLNRKKSIVVSGTHGKTTTTSLLAHVFNASGPGASFMVGGIPINFNKPSLFSGSDFFILEGDEYDSAFFEKFPKFHHYMPHILILNNIEFDHADIYQSLDEIKKQFRYLLRLVPGNGLVIANTDDENVREVLKSVYSPVLSYGKTDHVDYRFRIVPSGRKFNIEIVHCDAVELQAEIPFPLDGMGYNITASYIASRKAGISSTGFKKDLESFKGVRRRLELLFENNQYKIYDDFAHHPTAVSATLRAVKTKYPGQPLIALFEPRSNTSSKNIFLEEYKQAFSAADIIFLAPPYQKSSAQTENILDVQSIKHHIEKFDKKVIEISKNYDELLRVVNRDLPQSGIIVLMSNGSFEPFKSNLIQFITGK